MRATCADRDRAIQEAEAYLESRKARKRSHRGWQRLGMALSLVWTVLCLVSATFQPPTSVAEAVSGFCVWIGPVASAWLLVRLGRWVASGFRLER